ncbi:hypothetical protein GCM10010350_75670 [Streptomyces galilaeus]|nr:hypothetical protein GCM10010350_75670 [Streptomyces galilaeus]
MQMQPAIGVGEEDQVVGGRVLPFPLGHERNETGASLRGHGAPLPAVGGVGTVGERGSDHAVTGFRQPRDKGYDSHV